MIMIMIPQTILLLAALAQVPNPTPAINAAKDAKAKTEAAQQKNAEALDPQAGKTPPPAQPPATPPPATPGATGPHGQGTSGAGYSYDPAGRRDPFVSLTARGGELPPVQGRGPPEFPGSS